MRSSKELKKQLVIAAVSVILSAFALSSATYAWFATNSTVHATTSTISAQANGMVLQIVAGNTPEHGGKDANTVASQNGHEISPSSTNDAQNWYVPSTWKATDVSNYAKANIVEKASGKYTQGGPEYYAYTLGNYTLYTVNNTGEADVYLDGSKGSPITITKSDGASDEWFDKIKKSLRVGILIDDELRVVYAPAEPTGHGNDVSFTNGWSCVNADDLSKTMAPTYEHLFGDSLVNDSGDWGAAKSGESYVKPSGTNPQKIAEKVNYNGTNLKIVIWMEGTDADCQNMSGLKPGTENPTFNVTVSLVGVVPDSN